MAACVVVFFTHTHTRAQLNAALAAPKSRQAFYTLTHTHTHAYCEQLKHIKQLCEHILTRFYFAKFFPIALLVSLTSPLTSLPAASGKQHAARLDVSSDCERQRRRWQRRRLRRRRSRTGAQVINVLILIALITCNGFFT